MVTWSSVVHRVAIQGSEPQVGWGPSAVKGEGHGTDSGDRETTEVRMQWRSRGPRGGHGASSTWCESMPLGGLQIDSGTVTPGTQITSSRLYRIRASSITLISLANTARKSSLPSTFVFCQLPWDPAVHVGARQVHIQLSPDN